MDRILEEDLQLPTLYLIEQDNGNIITSELSEKLRNILNPKGEDLEILSTRNDDKFSQIVRNLTAAERSFVKNGYISRESGRNKPLFITDKGRKYLNENLEVVEYLFANNFNFKDILESFKKVQNENKDNRHTEIFDENIIINEGTQRFTKTKNYKRSTKLREKAIEYYTVGNKIKCQACCFDFEDFYGEYGKNFIEIHHQKPVFQFDGDDIEKTIERALKNVIPVCANCHRMIHRKREIPLSLEKLKSYIQRELDFCDE